MKVRTVLAGGVAGVLTLSWLTAPPAYAAAPTVTLIAPVDGGTAPTRDVALSVRAADPDGGPLQVTFQGRKRGATVPGDGAGTPFSLVVLPDTQNYTYANRQGTMVQQTQWVVNTRSQLATAMVVQLGDLVSEEENPTQWGHVSNALRVLDDAGVPNTVVAGNHDFNNATGGFTEYDQTFPPSRYANAAWTPATARYGGYLGENLFGPDPIDRRNMNNFALFSAGGRDFLVLNLEWEASQQVVDWATKVLAAYPDRLAILVTHSFVQLNGNRRTTAERPGGTPTNQLWTEFVSQQCQIRLVLNGHFHNGDAGEARRTDPNRCGDPVHQILSNYQSRANGGDGWLRYYTIDPGASTITARTYSPKLGSYETDADSQFTLPFDLGGSQPAPFETIGTVTVDAGDVAGQTWPGLDPDTGYEWRAVISDGQNSTTSPTWQVWTPPAAEAIDDPFSRTVTNGWGSTPSGQAWQLTSGASAYSVSDGAGRIVAPIGSTRGVRLPSAQLADATIATDLALSPAASGSGTYVSVLGRLGSAGSYRAKLRYLAGGGVNLFLIRHTGSETILATSTLPGLTVASGQYLRLRFELTGSSPTTLRAKLWRRDQAEPSSWTLTATDNTAGLQHTGSVGIDVYPSSSATSPSTVAFDSYAVTPPNPTPPANQPPVAVIGTPSVDERTVTLSGSGSSDPDGSIVGYRWDFGDGTTATGPTVSHTYPADGSYTVTLTVTDDHDATAQATRKLTVAETPPQAQEIAADDFERSVSNGWGAAQPGGAWSGAGSRYAVAGGTGNHVLTSPGTTAETTLPGVSARDLELRTSLAWSRTAAQGTIYGTTVVRRQANGSDYRLKVVVGASGAIQLVLGRKVGGVETTLRSAIVTGLTQQAEVSYRIAVRVVSVGGVTTLSGKLWRAGTAEPGAWLVTATDTTAGLQTAGSVGLNSYLSGAAAAGITTRVDDLLVVAPQ